MPGAHKRAALGKGRICASRRENESQGDGRAMPVTVGCYPGGQAEMLSEALPGFKIY